MAFTVIPSSWLNVGEAIKKRLFTRIKDDLDDHETRLNAVEAGINRIDIFNFEVTGYIFNYPAAELVGVGTYKAPQNIIITEVKVIILNSASSPYSSSSAGSLKIDLERSTNNGATWATVLSSQPTIGDGSYAAGAESAMVSFITNGEILLADQLLRVNVTSKKDSQGSFQIITYGDLS